jgi:hypothetical protein
MNWASLSDYTGELGRQDLEGGNYGGTVNPYTS